MKRALLRLLILLGAALPRAQRAQPYRVGGMPTLSDPMGRARANQILPDSNYGRAGGSGGGSRGSSISPLTLEGMKLLEEDADPRHCDDAVEKFTRADDKGDATAALMLGLMNWQGLCMEPDPVQARAHLATAAHRRHMQGKLLYSIMLSRGIGGPADGAEALRLAAEAALKGDNRGAILAGHYRLRGVGDVADRGAALRWFGRAAQRRDPTACHRLVVFSRLAAGIIGPRTASFCEEVLRESGYTQVEDDVATVRAMGWGDAQSEREALERLHAAAAGGSAAARLGLSDLHEFGVGVPRDPAAAERWLDAAAEAGSPLAQRRVALHELQRGAGANRPRAIELLRRAALGGDPPSPQLLGLLYAQPDGPEYDPIEAWAWLKFRVYGPVDTGADLARIDRALTPEQRIEAQYRALAIRTAKPEPAPGSAPAPLP